MIPFAGKASANGSTWAHILDSIIGGELRDLFEPRLLIVSDLNAGVIQKSLDRGLLRKNIVLINRKTHPNFLARGEAEIAECRERGIELIGQYGWVLLTPPNVVEEFNGRMINQHPGPLHPGHLDFGGKGMQGRAVHLAVLVFSRLVKRPFLFTEATAQRVHKEFDKGAILSRVCVPIRKSDRTSGLQKRVLPKEHKLQVEVLRQFAEGTVTEWTRPEPLIFPGEEGLLELAKKIAISKYPHG